MNKQRSKMLLKVREFLSDSEFHSLKYLTRADSEVSVYRKLFWSALFLSSLVAFITLTTQRFEYFYTYPYSTRMKFGKSGISLPPMAVCKDIHVEEIHWIDLEDIDALYLSGLYMTAQLTKLSSENKLIIDTNALQLVRDVSESIRNDNLSYTEDMLDTFADKLDQIMDTHFVVKEKFKSSMQSFKRYLIRLAVIRDDILQNINAEHGRIDIRNMLADVTAFRLQDVVSCMMLMGEYKEARSCLSSMREVFIDGLPCVALPDIAGQNMVLRSEQRDVEERVEVTLDTTSLDHVKGVQVLVYLYDKDEILSESFQDLEEMTYTLRSGHNLEIALTKVENFTRLSRPHNALRCVRGRRSKCLVPCLAENIPCNMMYMSAWQRALTADRDQCPFHWEIHNFPSHLLDRCMEECAPSCSHVDITANSDEQSQTEPGAVSITLRGDKRLVRYSYSEDPTYSQGALLAEVGGMLGLFLGASALSIAHLCEFLYRSAWMVLSKTWASCRNSKGGVAGKS